MVGLWLSTLFLGRQKNAYHSSKTLKKAFEWTDECQKAFEELKTYLASPPLFSPSKPDKELSLYWSYPQRSSVQLSFGKRVACSYPSTILVERFKGRGKIPPYGKFSFRPSHGCLKAQVVLPSTHYSGPD